MEPKKHLQYRSRISYQSCTRSHKLRGKNIYESTPRKYSLFCCLTCFQAPQNYSHTQRNPHVYYRHEVINQLQETNHLVTIVADNLASYMNKVYTLIEGKGMTIIIDDRFCGIIFTKLIIKFWYKMWLEL